MDFPRRGTLGEKGCGWGQISASNPTRVPGPVEPKPALQFLYAVVVDFEQVWHGKLPLSFTGTMVIDTFHYFCTM